MLIFIEDILLPALQRLYLQDEFLVLLPHFLLTQLTPLDLPLELQNLILHQPLLALQALAPHPQLLNQHLQTLHLLLKTAYLAFILETFITTFLHYGLQLLVLFGQVLLLPLYYLDLLVTLAHYPMQLDVLNTHFLLLYN